jgi:hypothetical protein
MHRLRAKGIITWSDFSVARLNAFIFKPRVAPGAIHIQLLSELVMK